MNISRMTPPTAPVVIPMMMATHMGNPASKLFSIPTTVNNPRPMASKIKKVLFNRITYLPNMITKNKANPVTIR